jgi:hypothetical protein
MQTLSSGTQKSSSRGPILVFLALIGLVPVMFVGERFGVIPGFVAIAAWCGACQFIRSRGDSEAPHRNWRRMALIAILPIAIFVLMVLQERPGVVFVQGSGILIAGLGGTWVGAFAASRLARRIAGRT